MGRGAVRSWGVWGYSQPHPPQLHAERKHGSHVSLPIESEAVPGPALNLLGSLIASKPCSHGIVCYLTCAEFCARPGPDLLQVMTCDITQMLYHAWHSCWPCTEVLQVNTPALPPTPLSPPLLPAPRHHPISRSRPTAWQHCMNA